MDLRKQRTLKYLSESLSGLMLEKRYGDITVAEICDRAMVRRATFYRHFSGKDDLLKFIIRSSRDQIKEKVDPDSSLSLREFCFAMTEVLLEIIEKQELLLRKASSSSDLIQIGALFSQEISSEFEKYIEQREEVSSIEASDTEHKQVLADFYTFGLMGAIEQVFLKGKPFNKEAFLVSFEKILDRLFAD